MLAKLWQRSVLLCVLSWSTYGYILIVYGSKLRPMKGDLGKFKVKILARAEKTRGEPPTFERY